MYKFICFCGKETWLLNAVFIRYQWWCSEECSRHDINTLRVFPFYKQTSKN